MKVLNLRCGNEHRFEGWFASHEAYADQLERGLLACPMCGDARVDRLPSAPRLNVATARGDARNARPASSSAHGVPSPARGVEEPPAEARALAGGAPSPTMSEPVGRLWMDAVRTLMARTEDVGDRFPEEARRIHYGEAKERSIRGHASAEDAEALRDEGIEIVAVPVPDALKGPIQ